MAYVHTKLRKNWSTGSKLKLNDREHTHTHTHTKCGDTISLLPLLYAIRNYKPVPSPVCYKKL
jgi:hypothetical protein